MQRVVSRPTWPSRRVAPVNNISIVKLSYHVEFEIIFVCLGVYFLVIIAKLWWEMFAAKMYSKTNQQGQGHIVQIFLFDFRFHTSLIILFLNSNSILSHNLLTNKMKEINQPHSKCCLLCQLAYYKMVPPLWQRDKTKEKPSQSPAWFDYTWHLDLDVLLEMTWPYNFSDINFIHPINVGTYTCIVYSIVRAKQFYLHRNRAFSRLCIIVFLANWFQPEVSPPQFSDTIAHRR